EREASQDWNTQLAQGDPLNQVSTHEPKRMGPFKTWEEGAIAGRGEGGRGQAWTRDVQTLGRRLDSFPIIGGQGTVDIAQVSDRVFSDFRTTDWDRAPETLADDLELHRLDVRAKLLLRLSRQRRNADAPQIIDKFPGGGIGKAYASILGRF